MVRSDVPCAVAGFLVLSILWGTQFLVIREGLIAMPALLAVSLRFAVLAVAGAIAAGLTSAVAPPGTGRARVFFGLAQALSFALLYAAQKSLDSTIAGLLSSTTPLFVAVLAHVFVQGERIRPSVLVALALGGGGAALLIITSKEVGAPTATLSIVLVLIGELAGATNKVLGKALVARVPPFILLRDMGLIVAGATGLSWLAFERNAAVVLSARAIVAFAYLGLIASFVGSALYMRLLQILPVTTLGYLQFATALVASTAGVVLGGERMALGPIAAATAILTGLVVLAWTTSRHRAKESRW